ncbi:MAG: twin-arginine translocation signal domain-containing protein [candidate division Zixibacteria bacterium]|nr:twin-arginine translocation signal domain-containing protein [candidate division Zixibacteria bacterium]
MPDLHDKPEPEISPAPETQQTGISRRGFLKGVGAGAVTATVVPAVWLSHAENAAAQTSPMGVTDASIQLKVNGKIHTVQVEARTTLASALRDRLDVTSPKLVCDRGECGACTVLIDGKTVYSCIMLALDAVGRDITTVESLASGETLHPIQEAFIEKDALMCGFCTPGFVMAVKALLDANPNPTLEEVKRGVSGNICRCGTYPRVFEAALEAARKMKKGG